LRDEEEAFREEEGHELVMPQAKERDERRPEEQELDRGGFSEDVWSDGAR